MFVMAKRVGNHPVSISSPPKFARVRQSPVKRGNAPNHQYKSP
jgi:hypothetical protein